LVHLTTRHINATTEIFAVFVVIKAQLTTREYVNYGDSLSFPDPDDDISLFGGHTASVILPNGVLKSILHNSPPSKHLTIG